jgi:hypothetical protein
VSPLGVILSGAFAALSAFPSPTAGRPVVGNVPARPVPRPTHTFTAKRQAKAAARLRSQGR